MNCFIFRSKLAALNVLRVRVRQELLTIVDDSISLIFQSKWDKYYICVFQKQINAKIYLQCRKIFRFGVILWGWGETESWKKHLKSKMSWHCPFKDTRNENDTGYKRHSYATLQKIPAHHTKETVRTTHGLCTINLTEISASREI